MIFDKQKISAMVQQMAARMLPGWTYELFFASSTADIGGALGMAESMPERKKFKMWIAPHPPGERVEETIPHELTHVMLSPLTHLLPPTASVVMIEEMIVEPLGIELAKLLDTMPQYARAVLRALHNPRTNAPAMRKRISALATRQGISGRKRLMDPKMIEEIIAAIKEGNGEAAIELLTKLLASAAGGSGGDGGPASAPMRDGEDKPSDSNNLPPMREGDIPPEAREYMRQTKRAAQSALSDTIRLRLHTAKTVDGIVLDPATEKDLASATSIDQFEREFKLVSRQATRATEQQRKRSGVEPEGHGNRNGSPSLDQLRREYPEQVANDIHRAFERGSDHGEVAVKAAAKYRKVAQNG